MQSKKEKLFSLSTNSKQFLTAWVLLAVDFWCLVSVRRNITIIKRNTISQDIT